VRKINNHIKTVFVAVVFLLFVANEIFAQGNNQKKEQNWAIWNACNVMVY
jgi:hypothetical protein